MSNKTAVDLLVDSLPLRIQNMYASEIENAKAMEKEQIMNAYMDAYGNKEEPEDYYKQTYEK